MPDDKKVSWVRLDLLDAALAAAEAGDDAARGRWFAALIVGASGRTIVADDAASKSGHAYGVTLAAEARIFKDKKSTSGAKGAVARWQKNGDAMAMPSRRYGDAMANDGRPIARTEQNRTEQAVVAPSNAHAGELQDTPKPPPPPPSGNLADLRAMHPAFLPIGADDIDRAKRMLSLYGFDICNKRLARLTAEAAKRAPGKRRVLVGEWADDLAANVELAVEDYAAAGLPAPPGTPTQDELNRKDS
jgi:hypothetical protein